MRVLLAELLPVGVAELLPVGVAELLPVGVAELLPDHDVTADQSLPAQRNIFLRLP